MNGFVAGLIVGGAVIGGIWAFKAAIVALFWKEEQMVVGKVTDEINKVKSKLP